MSAENLAAVQPHVNTERKRLVAKLRRMARRHNLRMVTHREREVDSNNRNYQLQSVAVLAGTRYGLRLEDIAELLRRLEARS